MTKTFIDEQIQIPGEFKTIHELRAEHGLDPLVSVCGFCGGAHYFECPDCAKYATPFLECVEELCQAT